MILPVFIDRITTLVQPFADFYADSKPMAIGTTAVHIGGMLAGGGLAIATDRSVLRMSLNDGSGQRAVLEDLASTHRLVIGSIMVSLISGLAFLAADLKTFLSSPVYWSKMAVVLLLLLNGLRLWRAEARLQKSAIASAGTQPMPSAEWRALRNGATTSLVLWFGVMILGVVLEGS